MNDLQITVPRVEGEAGPAALRIPATGSLSVRPLYRAAVVLQPFQFGSIEEYRRAADEAMKNDVATRGLSERTLRWWRESLHTFLGFLVRTKNDRQFLSGDLERQVEILERWVRWLREERRVSHITVRTYWSALASIGQRLERARGLVNPFGILEPPKAGRAQPRVLTKGQTERLLGAIAQYQWSSEFLRARNLFVAAAMLLAGLRRGEVLRLQATDVDAREGWLHVREGKGRYGGKSRTAYMGPQLCMIAARYLDERRAVGRTTPSLVTLATRDAAMTPTAVKRLFVRLSTLVGFHVSPHMCRHTYATLLRMSGVADRVSMELMGHESLSMLKRYSHVFETEFHTEAQKLRLDVDL